MRPINELPLKVGETYYLARHETGFGPYIVKANICEIKESKPKRWFTPDHESWSIKLKILDNPNPYGADNNTVSWLHKETIKLMERRWLNLNGSRISNEKAS